MAIIKNNINIKKLTTMDMEVAVADFFNTRVNIVVPNISWGMGIHECDLLVISKRNYASEVEIKVSKQDLIKDLSKKHGHESDKIKYLYFAIPDYLEQYQDIIPVRAGIIVVNNTVRGGNVFSGCCTLSRSPQINSNYKFSDAEKFNAARLGTMRIWTLKRKILRIYEKNNKFAKT
jgi:hypothetical protein